MPTDLTDIYWWGIKCMKRLYHGLMWFFCENTMQGWKRTIDDLNIHQKFGKYIIHVRKCVSAYGACNTLWVMISVAELGLAWLLKMLWQESDSVATLWLSLVRQSIYYCGYFICGWLLYNSAQWNTTNNLKPSLSCSLPLPLKTRHHSALFWQYNVFQECQCNSSLLCIQTMTRETSTNFRPQKLYLLIVLNCSEVEALTFSKSLKLTEIIGSKVYLLC